MAPPRRVRDEVLTLRKPDSPDVELFRAKESLYEGQFPTQRRFQVSPDARVCAHVAPNDNSLYLNRRDGTGSRIDSTQQEFRFSPDGQSLAVMTWRSDRALEFVDLKTWQTRRGSTSAYVSWMEYCAEGLVLLQYDKWDGDRFLMLASPENPARLIAKVDARARRFVAAKNGSHIAYFVGNQVWSLANLQASPELWAQFDRPITNAEMTPDGQTIVVATEGETYLLQRGESPKEIGVIGAHTVWFSRDGSQFVVANTEKAKWQRADKKITLLADEQGPIRSARFAQGSPWIMVARGQQALRWNPEHEEAEEIARVGDDEEMLGVDVFRNGLLLWSGGKWERFGWGGKRID